MTQKLHLYLVAITTTPLYHVDIATTPLPQPTPSNLSSYVSISMEQLMAVRGKWRSC